MKLSEIKKEDLYISMKLISAIGNDGEIVEIKNVNQNLNDTWVKVLWSTGNISEFPWDDKGDGPWSWEHVTIKEKNMDAKNEKENL